MVDGPRLAMLAWNDLRSSMSVPKGFVLDKIREFQSFNNQPKCICMYKYIIESLQKEKSRNS